MISNNLVKVPLNDVVMEIVEGIWRLKNATFSQSDEVYTAYTRNESIIRCNRDNFSSAYPTSCVRGSVIQTLIYLLSKYKLTNNKNIFFKASEVTRIRGMAVRAENRKALLEDLNFLSEMEMEIHHTVKRIKQETHSRILRFRVLKQSIQVVLGSWIKAVSPDKYVELPLEFFQYKGLKYSLTILALLKITQLKHMSKTRLRVASLLGFLGYDQLSLHRKTLSAVILQVTNILIDINKVHRGTVNLSQLEFTSLDELQNTLIIITPHKKVDTS